jgi:hypothetical protein
VWGLPQSLVRVRHPHKIPPIRKRWRASISPRLEYLRLPHLMTPAGKFQNRVTERVRQHSVCCSDLVPRKVRYPMAKRRKASDLKNSTALSSSLDSDVEAVRTGSKRSTKSPPNVDTLVKLKRAQQHPLDAVTTLPERQSSEPGNSKTQDAGADEVGTHSEVVDPPQGLMPCDITVKLMAMGLANTVCMSALVGRYSLARTPEEVLAATTEFYKEQGRLLSGVLTI